MRRGKRSDVLFFHMAGPLIDSPRDISTAVNFTLKKMGLGQIEDEVVRLFVGSGLNALIEATFREEGMRCTPRVLKQARKHFEKFYWRHCTDETCWYPHVVPALKKLVGKRRLVVFTNKPQPFAEKILRALKGEPFFEEVIAAIGGEPRKPDPKAALELLQKWGVGRTDALLVGDSLIDRDTARRGRFDFALVDHGFSKIPPGERKKIRYRFKTFSSLQRWIRESSRRGRTRRPRSRGHR